MPQTYSQYGIHVIVSMISICKSNHILPETLFQDIPLFLVYCQFVFLHDFHMQYVMENVGTFVFIMLYQLRLEVADHQTRIKVHDT